MNQRPVDRPEPTDLTRLGVNDSGTMLRRDLFDAVERLDRGFRKRLLPAQPDSHDPVRGSVSGSERGCGALGRSSWSHFVEIIYLKLERFKPADKGQMEMYLRWLEKYEMEQGEGTPLGLILCADKRDEQVERLQLDKSGIRVASYLTELPPRQLAS